MRVILLAVLMLGGCLEGGQTPPPDAMVDARPDAAPVPVCQEIGCETPESLADPNCTLTGAQCVCDDTVCRWMP